MGKYYGGITGLGGYPFFVVPNGMFFSTELFVFFCTEPIAVFDHLGDFKSDQLDKGSAYPFSRFPGDAIDFAIGHGVVG